MMRKLKKLNPNNAMDGISIISTNYRSANASSIDEHNKRKNPKTFNVEEYFAKKAISRMKTKKFSKGTYADENDSLSEPDTDLKKFKLESEYQYLHKLNKESQKVCKTGVNDRHKMQHFSNMSSKLDLNNISVGTYSQKQGSTVEDYFKPSEPEYYKK